MSAREKKKVDKQCVEILQRCVDDKRNRKIIPKSNRLSKKLRIQTFHNVRSPETVMTFFHLCRITVVRCNFHP